MKGKSLNTPVNYHESIYSIFKRNQSSLKNKCKRLFQSGDEQCALLPRVVTRGVKLLEEPLGGYVTCFLLVAFNRIGIHLTTHLDLSSEVYIQLSGPGFVLLQTLNDVEGFVL